MDQMSGYELPCEIRGDEQLKERPLILATRGAKTEVVVAAKKAGVDTCIIKLFNCENLKSKIEAILFTARSRVAPELQRITCPAVLTYA